MLVKTFPDTRLQETVTHGRGLFLYTDTGKQYLDFTSGITAHSILGYGNAAIVNAIKSQAERICHVDYKQFSDGVREELADLLLSKKDHDLDAVYFVGASGGEACEAAMKLSFAYHLANGEGSRSHFISRRQGYHGSTSDTLAIGDRPNLKIFEPFYPDSRHKISEHNYIRNRMPGETPDEYCDRCVEELKKKIQEVGPKNVAAFIGETTLGGLVGDVVPHQQYWQKIRRVCDEFGVHLILDEVWCGTGTSGRIYSCDWDQVSPDFIFIGKTLGAGYGALSALITRSQIVRAIKGEFGSIPHSITHQGYTLSAAAALAAQKIIHCDNLLQNVNARSQQFKSCIDGALARCAHFVEVRGRGLRISIEYKTDDNHWFGTTIAGLLRERHGILISGKWHRLSVAPALIVDEETVERVATRIAETFLEVSRNFDDYKRELSFDGSFF